MKKNEPKRQKREEGESSRSRHSNSSSNLNSNSISNSSYNKNEIKNKRKGVLKLMHSREYKGLWMSPEMKRFKLAEEKKNDSQLDKSKGLLIKASISSGANESLVHVNHQINTNNELNTCHFCNMSAIENVMFCEGKDCSRSCHVSCLDPSLKRVPPGTWLCMPCVQKYIQFGPHNISQGPESIWDVKDGKKYFVKYKNLAHVHNRWLSEAEIMQEAPLLFSEFNSKICKEKGPKWNKEWTQPHRLLKKRTLMAVKTAKDFFANNKSLRYCNDEWLVKWRGLDYDQATWELDTSSFLRTGEAMGLMVDFDSRRQLAKQVSNPDYIIKALEVKQNPLNKLEKLSLGYNDHLNCINQLRKFWHDCRYALLIGEQERVIKTILFIMSVKKDICRPILIVSNENYLHLWESKFQILESSLNVITYTGTKLVREFIQDLEFFDEDGCIMFEVLLSHSDAILEDFEIIESMGWEAVIIDECKSFEISKILSKLKNIRTDFRLILLSSPLKDDVSEYTNMLSYLDPYTGLNHIINKTDTLNILKEKITNHVIYERKKCNSEDNLLLKNQIELIQKVCARRELAVLDKRKKYISNIEKYKNKNKEISKMSKFEEHVKNQYKRLEELYNFVRDLERNMKEKWVEEAKLGHFDESFGILPIEFYFSIEEFKDNINEENICSSIEKEAPLVESDENKSNNKDNLLKEKINLINKVCEKRALAILEKHKKDGLKIGRYKEREMNKNKNISKMHEFDEHVKRQYERLEELYAFVRDSEKNIKDNWVEKAKLGDLDEFFDNLPFDFYFSIEEFNWETVEIRNTCHVKNNEEREKVAKNQMVNQEILNEEMVNNETLSEAILNEEMGNNETVNEETVNNIMSDIEMVDILKNDVANENMTGGDEQVVNVETTMVSEYLVNEIVEIDLLKETLKDREIVNDDMAIENIVNEKTLINGETVNNGEQIVIDEIITVGEKGDDDVAKDQEALKNDQEIELINEGDLQSEDSHLDPATEDPTELNFVIETITGEEINFVVDLANEDIINNDEELLVENETMQLSPINEELNNNEELLVENGTTQLSPINEELNNNEEMDSEPVNEETLIEAAVNNEETLIEAVNNEDIINEEMVNELMVIEENDQHGSSAIDPIPLSEPTTNPQVPVGHTHGNTESATSDPMIQSVTTQPPNLIMPLINSCLISSDPLKNELFRIQQQYEALVLSHNQKRMKQKAEGEKEIEKIRKKYEDINMKNKVAFQKQKLWVVGMYQKLALNISLSEEFHTLFFKQGQISCSSQGRSQRQILRPLLCAPPFYSGQSTFISPADASNSQSPVSSHGTTNQTPVQIFRPSSREIQAALNNQSQFTPPVRPPTGDLQFIPPVQSTGDLQFNRTRFFRLSGRGGPPQVMHHPVRRHNPFAPSAADMARDRMYAIQQLNDLLGIRPQSDGAGTITGTGTVNVGPVHVRGLSGSFGNNTNAADWRSLIPNFGDNSNSSTGTNNRNDNMTRGV